MSRGWVSDYVASQGVGEGQRRLQAQVEALTRRLAAVEDVVARIAGPGVLVRHGGDMVTERQRVAARLAAMRATGQVEVPMKHGMRSIYSASADPAPFAAEAVAAANPWLSSEMSVKEYLATEPNPMEVPMEPNDVQPDVESEREKAAYQRGYAAGVAAARAEMVQALTVGEGYRDVAPYGTDPTWPVPGASER